MKKQPPIQLHPVEGFFNMIAAVDEFILYDDMQYSWYYWRNRNQMQDAEGVCGSPRQAGH